MTLRAIGGLATYNILVFAVGSGLLWGLGGWRYWTDLLRLAGVAYLLGLATMMVALTLELVAGIPLTLATAAVSGGVIFFAGVGLGVLRGHPHPSLPPHRWRVPGISFVAALFVAAIVVFLEALFRAGRLASIGLEWDGWAFWVPKGKALYFFGELDTEFLFTLPPWTPSYPPGLPALHGLAFHAMGSADSVTLHLQYWFYAAGFIAAVVGLLATRVRHGILFPLVLVVLVMPGIVYQLVSVNADIPLAYLVASSALLLILWLEERQDWQLATVTVLLSGAILTKREGILLVACVVLAGFAASFKERRALWPRLAVAVIVAGAITLPWRVWFTVQGLPSDGPTSGYIGSFGHLERVRPAFELVVTTFFDTDLWLVVPILAAGALGLAIVARAWQLSAFTAVFAGAAFAAATWAIWANTALSFTPDNADNPVVRLLGTPILVLALLTPLLLERAWGNAARIPPHAPARGWKWFMWRSRLTWTIVAVAALAYPGSAIVGYSGQTLPGGLPRFPSAADCVVPTVPGQGVRLVVGYADSYSQAQILRARARAAGLGNTEVGRDGCGRLRVFVDDLSSIAASRPLFAEATTAELEPTVELDPDP